MKNKNIILNNSNDISQIRQPNQASQTNQTKLLSSQQTKELLGILEERFEKNYIRHSNILWADVEARLEDQPTKLWSLAQMEATGGEPDVIGFDDQTGEYVFYDCSPETPKGRRSLCFDEAALRSRKEHKPETSAQEMANEFGIELLDEKQYRHLQKLGSFDLKTSSWIQTPEEIRRLGGALFCDCRYDTVFVYHNGAESYYGSRGFRGVLKV